MMKKEKKPYVFNSISELNRTLGLPQPLHPLVCVNNYKDIKVDTREMSKGMVMNLYKISYKKNLTGKFRYGQSYYDFNEGGLCFISPLQLIQESEERGDYDGFTLLIHPDFLLGYPLAKNIKNYGFFSYSTTEALHPSEKEKETIMSVMKNMKEELALPIDQFSQDVLISQIELLLNYSNRFYTRQFVTRKPVNHYLLTRLEAVVNDYFNGEKGLVKGLPTVQFLSDELHVSPRYLSDMLRSVTGQNTQQYIHDRLVEKAKEILTVTDLSVAEIAYQLGFEHPQSFHKVFKRKTNVSPIEFRESLN